MSLFTYQEVCGAKHIKQRDGSLKTYTCKYARWCPLCGEFKCLIGESFGYDGKCKYREDVEHYCQVKGEK